MTKSIALMVVGALALALLLAACSEEPTPAPTRVTHADCNANPCTDRVTHADCNDNACTDRVTHADCNDKRLHRPRYPRPLQRQSLHRPRYPRRLQRQRLHRPPLPAPIATPIPVPTASSTRTATPIPAPTASPTRTATPIPAPTASSTPTATPIPAPTAPTIASLDVTALPQLTSIGETAQLAVTANMSDASHRDVGNSLVQWESSDSWVATVSEGVVTAVGGGNASITATYEGLIAEAPVSVRISQRSPGTVRVLYAAPADREFRSDYRQAIQHAIVDLQSWYRRELNGLTFSLYDPVVQHCQMSQTEDFYSRGDAWDKVVADVQHCAPVRWGTSDFTWVIYADVMESCDEYLELGEDAHELGRGGLGLTILPRGDLDGLTTPGVYYYCGEGPYDSSLGRFIGGLGHELGHAFGLPHPPGCDPWQATTCNDLESLSLMHDGYEAYPETYLLPADRELLMRSPFFSSHREPLAAPPANLGLDSFYKKYLDADGLPIVASSAVPDSALYRARGTSR